MCRKDDLYAVASHYEISVFKSMKKSELKALVVSRLIEKGVFLLEVETEDAASVSESSDEPEVCAEEGTGTPAVVKPEGGSHHRLFHGLSHSLLNPLIPV